MSVTSTRNWLSLSSFSSEDMFALEGQFSSPLTKQTPRLAGVVKQLVFKPKTRRINPPGWSTHQVDPYTTNALHRASFLYHHLGAFPRALVSPHRGRLRSHRCPNQTCRWRSTRWPRHHTHRWSTDCAWLAWTLIPVSVGGCSHRLPGPRHPNTNTPHQLAL